MWSPTAAANIVALAVRKHILVLAHTSAPTWAQVGNTPQYPPRILGQKGYIWLAAWPPLPLLFFAVRPLIAVRPLLKLLRLVVHRATQLPWLVQEHLMLLPVLRSPAASVIHHGSITACSIV